MKKKILISTGGSGGHVIPATTIYDHLKNNFEVIISTDVRGLNYLEVEKHKITSLEKICSNEGMEPVIFNLSEYMKSGAMLSCMVMHLNRVDHFKTLIFIHKFILK